MTVVDVLGRVDELADGTGGSVDAAIGAAIGPYRKSRTRLENPLRDRFAANIHLEHIVRVRQRVEGVPVGGYTVVLVRDAEAMEDRVSVL